MTFFALTIFNLLALFFFRQIVAYGMASMIKWMRIIGIIYGLTVIVLGILCIVLEGANSEEIGNSVWAALSTNQKDFFENDVANL